MVGMKASHVTYICIPIQFFSRKNSNPKRQLLKVKPTFLRTENVKDWRQIQERTVEEEAEEMERDVIMGLLRGTRGFDVTYLK